MTTTNQTIRDLAASLLAAKPDIGQLAIIQFCMDELHVSNSVVRNALRKGSVRGWPKGLARGVAPSLLYRQCCRLVRTWTVGVHDDNDDYSRTARLFAADLRKLLKADERRRAKLAQKESTDPPSIPVE